MLNWSQINTVLLDMDGTLLDLHFDNYFWQHYVPRCYAEQQGITPSAALETLTHKFQAFQGQLQWYCLDFWSEQLGLDIPTLKQHQAERIALRQHVPEFLLAARAAGKELRLVTNAHHKTIAIKFAQHNLAPYFDRVVCSHDYNAPKEHAEFWQKFQADQPFDPNTSVFFDDSAAVLAAARDFGIAHIVAMAWPDSQRPPAEIAGFSNIQHFTEVMPISGSSSAASPSPSPA